MGEGSPSLSPMVFGHQRVFCCHSASLSGDQPPNSLPAVMECIEAGVPRLEVDVRFLTDDAMLIFHDATLDRATSAVGRVDELTRRDVESVRYRSDPRVGLCFLEEVVDAIAGSRSVLQVDLKLTRPISERRARLLESTLRALGDRVIVGSQAHWNLRALNTLPIAFDPTLHWCYSEEAPGIPRSRGVHGLWDDSPMASNARFAPGEYLEHRIRDLRGLLPQAVEWMVDISTILKMAEMGLALGDRLKRDGCSLAAWTLHEATELPEVLSGLFKAGSETVITDAPELAAEAAAGLGL